MRCKQIHIVRGQGKGNFAVPNVFECAVENIRMSVCLNKHHPFKAFMEEDVDLQLFVILLLDAGGWLASHPGIFPPERRACDTRWIGVLMLRRIENTFPLKESNLDSVAIQPSTEGVKQLTAMRVCSLSWTELA
jgi:hypothetical protein